jgi:hypothetical protein
MAHLAVRFVGALDPRGPAPEEEAWAESWLNEGERSLWRRMSGPDRRHAAGVARDAARRLGRPPERAVMAAALLHDVGKIESGLGTFRRVAVTLGAMGLGRERLAAWGHTPSSRRTAARPEPVGARRRRRPRWRQRVADYLEHDRIGAQLCQEAGSDPLTVAWAEEHHRPESAWNVDPVIGRALKAADGD